MDRDVMDFTDEELEKFEREARIYRDDMKRNWKPSDFDMAHGPEIGASFARGAASLIPPMRRGDTAKFFSGSPRRFEGDETFEPITD